MQENRRSSANYVAEKRFNDKDKLVVIPTKKKPCNVEKYYSHHSENQNSESESQTQECFIYEFDNDNIYVTLIDTPGLGDTRGEKQDEENVNKIIDKLQTMTGFNSIVLIIPINNIRVVKKMLTKECQDNFIICFSNGSGDIEAAKSTLSQQGFDAKLYLKFENGFLYDFSMYERLQAEGAWNTNCKNFDILVQESSKMTFFQSSK